jgi:hypothetical protein
MASLKDLEAGIPGLVGTAYSEKSLATDSYNCIAFAVGDTQNWWWPMRGYGIYWPPGFPLSDAVDVLVDIFEVHGYTTCSDGICEIGYEKVAIYSNQGRFKHVARQLQSGRWVSKLGEEQDIEHEQAQHVECRAYGRISRFLRRRRNDWLPPEEDKGR